MKPLINKCYKNIFSQRKNDLKFFWGFKKSQELMHESGCDCVRYGIALFNGNAILRLNNPLRRKITVTNIIKFSF